MSWKLGKNLLRERAELLERQDQELRIRRAAEGIAGFSLNLSAVFDAEKAKGEPPYAVPLRKVGVPGTGYTLDRTIDRHEHDLPPIGASL